MQKFFFHNAVTTQTGTLPTATGQMTGATINTVTNAGINRTMNSTIGTAEASQTWTSLAQTTVQRWFLRRFLSPPLAAQTIAQGAWKLSSTLAQSNTNMFNSEILGYLNVWRPSSGAVVGTIYNSQLAASNLSTLNKTAQQFTLSSVSSTAVTVLDGDILVCELYAEFSQTMATAYTGTTYYDGTVDLTAAATGSTVTSAGALLTAPVDLAMSAAAAAASIPDIAMASRVT